MVIVVGTGGIGLMQVQIIHRPGAHHGYDDVNSYFDWFDTQFGEFLNVADRLASSITITCVGWLQ